tara:strand:- start:439 stop:1410 length:972 start_codon:yes stop_codon:yes gene_type:complete
MNILITGGLGVNGSWVTRKLVDRGYRPVVLESRRDFSIIGTDYEDKIELVEGDITDLDSVVAILKFHKINRIIDMAAIVSYSREVLHRAFQVNALGPVNIMEAASQCGVERIVFTSSRAAYGSVEDSRGHPTYELTRETDLVDPLNAYDVHKAAAEGMGRVYERMTGVQFVALRFAHIFGPGKSVRHGNFAVMSQLIELPLNGEPVTIARGGDQVDDVIYVDDMAEGVVLAALHDKPSYNLYNISRGIGTRLEDFAHAVRASIPDAQIDIGPGVDYLNLGAQYYGIMDNHRAKEDLGFEPRFDLETGVAAYIATLKQRGMVPA